MRYNNSTNEDAFIEKSLRKNKPNIALPIISTIFALFLIISVSVLFSKKEIELPFFIFSLIILITMPLASFYTNYFSKIKNQKKIYDFKDETEMLVVFAKKLRGYKMYDADEYLEIKFQYDDIEMQNIKYDYQKNILNDGKVDNSLLTIGVSLAGLIVDTKTNEVKTIAGLLPRSIWMLRKLKTPITKKGKVYIYHQNIKPFNIIKTLKDVNSYYDKNTGWLCIGNHKNKNTEAIQFMNQAILVLKENEIHALWIYVGKDILN